MTAAEVAKHYMKFWFQDQAGNWKLADNAPSTFWTALQNLPKDTDRNIIHSALASLATKKPIMSPAPDALLHWLAVCPGAVARCDEILMNPTKNKVSSLPSLLAKAWQAEAHFVLDKLHKSFLA